MIDKIKSALNSKILKQLLDVRNIGLYIFGIVVLAIAWSGARTVESNYQLQKQIVKLQQENEVLALQNGNASLQNDFYKTNEYLELSARQNLGLAAPGEKVMIVPQAVALKYVDKSLLPTAEVAQQVKTGSKYSNNLEDWRDFLLGRKLFED